MQVIAADRITVVLELDLTIGTDAPLCISASAIALLVAVAPAFETGLPGDSGGAYADVVVGMGVVCGRRKEVGGSLVVDLMATEVGWNVVCRREMNETQRGSCRFVCLS